MKRTMQPVYWIVLFVVIFHFFSSNSISAMIDFRDQQKFGGLGETSFSTTVIKPGLELRISAHPGEATLWWDVMDGYGVQHNVEGMLYDYEEDEIQGSEYLRISFSERVVLTGVSITDLFYENGYYETGLYSLNEGQSWNFFQAQSNQILGATNGEANIQLDALTKSIIFAAPGVMANQNHDFSIAGLSIGTVSMDSEDPLPTPIPSAVLLLGSGVFGLGLYRRCLSKKQ